MAEIVQWFSNHIGLTLGLAVAWVAMLVGTLWLGHWFLIRIPADYFTQAHPRLEKWRDSHPIWRWTMLVAKNALGIALVAAGLFMLFTPGQGILSLLLGLGFMDFPGKRAVERWIIQKPSVLRLVNRLRARAGQLPRHSPNNQLREHVFQSLDRSARGYVAHDTAQDRLVRESQAAIESTVDRRARIVSMLKNRKLGWVLLLAGIAAAGYLSRSLVPTVIDEYRRAAQFSPFWGWVYLGMLALSGSAFLGLFGWGVWTLLANTRSKSLRREGQSRNPSQMSQREKTNEIASQLAEGQALADDATLPADAQQPIREMLSAIEAKQQKQTLEIVAFGTVSGGKSSVLNALAGREAFRTDIKGGTTTARAEVPWPDGDRVLLVDTPGLAEIRGDQRQELAKQAARDADLVLFVTDGPLRDFEFAFLRQLSAMEKRIVVCVNKTDWYRPDDRDILVDQIARQVHPSIPRENVVALRAQATVRSRTRILADGAQSDETVEVEPDIRALADRMRAIVAADGHDLLLANLLLQSRGLVAEAKAQVKSHLDDRASAIVDRAMWQAGAAAALSPLPVVDLVAGLGITSHMVLELARVYRQRIDLDTLSRLLAELGKQLVSVAGADLAAPVAASGIASLLKTVPGAGTLSGGILQGLVQVLVTRWIGRVFIVYFRGEMQTPELGWASLARAQWAEVTRPEELARLVGAGLARLGGRRT